MIPLLRLRFPESAAVEQIDEVKPAVGKWFGVLDGQSYPRRLSWANSDTGAQRSARLQMRQRLS